MNIKYEVNQWGDPEITLVECIKETPKQVWVERTDYRGRKNVSKKLKQNRFFDTWGEARNFILDRTKTNLQVARRSLECQENELAMIEAMTEPTVENQP